MGISLFIMGISLTSFIDNIFIFCSSFFIFNIAWGLDSPAMNTIILDSVSLIKNEKEESNAFKIIYWISNLGMGIGFFVGSIISQFNSSITMYIFSLVFLISYIYLKFSFSPEKENLTSHNSSLKHFFIGYKKVFQDKKYINIIIIYGVIIMSELSMSSYVSIRLNNDFLPIDIFGIDITGIKMYSLLMIINTLTVIFMSKIIANITINWKNQNVFLIGLIMYMFGYVNIMYINNFYPLIICMVLAALGEIMYSPIIEQEKYKITPENKRGTYSGVSNLSFSIAEILARFFIIIGTIISSISMAVLLMTILTISIFLIYKTIYTN